MEKQLITIGQRVNVSTIIKEDWQSKHELYNGLVTEIREKYVRVRVDEKTTNSNFCSFAFGGLFYLGGYNITATAPTIEIN